MVKQIAFANYIVTSPYPGSIIISNTLLCVRYSDVLEINKLFKNVFYFIEC